MKNSISQRGAASIVLAILLLVILLVIGLGISALMLQQLKMSRQAGRSVVAFYAADAGAERCLYETRKNGSITCPFTDVPLDFSSQAKYTTFFNGLDMITSIGQFQGVSRKVELDW